MKILVGVADFNPGVKDYALPKLYENLERCVSRHADILFVSDRKHPIGYTHIDPRNHGFMSEDILYFAREHIRQYAVEAGYDAFIWQGSDCYYNSEWDFARFIRRSNAWDIDAVGALTSARTDSSFPVARRFTGRGTEQKNIPDSELRSGRIVPCYGFPGADALIVKGDLMKESLHQFPEFRPWYELREENPHSLCIEEYWIWKLGEKYNFFVDTSVRTWHAHEDGTARRWPGEEKSISDLRFA